MRFSLAARGRLLVTAVLWAVVAVSGQEITRTRITDTLFNADGSRAEGSLRISWKSFTGADGSTVAKNSVDLDIVDGIVSVALAPNLGAVPDGTYYSVEYRLHKGQKSNELWIVPDSEEPVSISDIRVLSVPSAGMSVSLSQVNGLPAALEAKADKAAGNLFTAPQVLREDAPGTSNPPLGLQKNDGVAGVYFRLPELSGDVTYTLPPNAGSPNQALTTDGNGALFWSSAAGGGAGSGSAYEVLQQGGSSVTQRTVANFASGFLVSDNAGQLRTDITPNFGTAAGTITQGNDSRLSNARTPLAHAATHAAAGSDPLTPASIGALNRTNDFMVGASPTTPVLKVQGSTGQAAALQEWRDGNGALAALITAQGNGFFRELGVSAPTGGTTVSQFFEVGGLKKFALSATDGVFDVLRYDNAGVFLDRPLRVFRSGNIETSVSMKVADASIGSGSLGLTGNYVELQGVGAPANPTSGFGRLFLNSATGELSVKKSSGSIVSLEGGAGGGGDFLGNFASPAELTVSSGSVTFPVSGAYLIDTQSDAPSDDWTGAACPAGASFSIRAASDARTVVIKGASIPTPSGADLSLDQDGDLAMVICQTTNAPEVVLFKDESGTISASGINGGTGGPSRIDFVEDGTAIADPVASGRVRFGIEDASKLIQTRAAGGSAKTYVTEADAQILTNKGVDGAANEIQVRRSTSPTALTDGVIGEVVADSDDGALYVCIPSTEACDTPGEWKAQAGDGLAARESFWLHDEFMGRVRTGTYGDLSWSVSGGTADGNGAASASHPGVIRRSTGGATNTLQTAYLREGTSQDTFVDLDNAVFVAQFVVSTNDASNSCIRIGFVAGNLAGSCASPTNGIYWQLNTGTSPNWHTVTRASGTETAKDTSTAADASWHTFEIRGDGSNITFYLDGALKGTHNVATENVPTAATSAAIANENLAAANRELFVDAFTMRMDITR